MRFGTPQLAAVGVALLLAGRSAAGDEVAAYDAAANYAAAGWTDVANLGQGWAGGWTLTEPSTVAGAFIATSAGNPRLRLGERAFGLWSDNGKLAEAIRTMAAPMPAGSAFRVRFQNLNVSSSRSQSVGVALRDAAGAILIQFYYNGGQSNYRVSDAAAGRATTLPHTDQALEVEILLLSASRYRLSAGGMTVEGDFAAPPAQIRFWNWSGWSGGNNDLFFDEPTVLVPPTPGVSSIVPEAPQNCDDVEIFYDARGGPLDGAEEVVLYVGRNGWKNPRSVPMEPLGGGLWRAEQTLRSKTVSLDWAFHDNGEGAARRWDNNARRDWRAALAPCATSGALAVDEPPWDARVENSRRTIDLRGRADGLDGPVHWRNETTGQEGWVDAAAHWLVPDVALGEGPNVIRISGTTAARSPNHGARDCATNAIYRDNGWQWRQNGGTGWGEWGLGVDGEAGLFIGTDASTNLTSHPFAWGLHSRNGGESRAVRRFGSPLRVGEVLRMKFENNFVQSGGSVGIALRDGFDQRLFSFLFLGGNATYFVNDDATNRDTGISCTTTGLNLTFELTSPTTYRFTAGTTTITGRLNPTADGQIRILRFWSHNAGTGSGHNAFLADLSIEAPEWPRREIAVRRTVERERGPEIAAQLLGPDGRVRVTVRQTDPDREYGVRTATDLAVGNWQTVGDKRRGDRGSLSFDLTNAAPRFFVAAEARPVKTWTIANPYAEVDWAEYERHKAALHMHTMMSDGGGRPHEVIDRYVALGHTIVSITDHDTQGPWNNLTHPDRARTTWPWEAFGRVPEALGVLAIEGNEISKRVHHGSYFNAFGAPDLQAEQDSLDAIAARGGLAVMFHPGRYTTGEDPITRDVAWYVGMFRSNPHLVGIEVFNQIDRFPGDRATWDAILTQLIDERPVWGYSNDDMHSMTSQLGFNYNIMLMPELSDEWMRRAMEQGVFFFVHSPHAHNGPPSPEVRAIRVSEADGTIAIETGGHDRIEWISEGALVHVGDEIRLGDVANLGRYVRAVVHAADSGAVLGTQPFRVVSLSR